MAAEPFTDYYEVLQLSPNADPDTIERVFRLLAARYHPDNPQTGNAERFVILLQARDVLCNRESRAGYDATYQATRSVQWNLVEEMTDGPGIDSDLKLRKQLLALLYVQRRRDHGDPGLGELDMERLLACPREHLEFHLWYMREKGWVQRMESGRLAITAIGVDRAEEDTLGLRSDRLLPKPAKE